MSNKTVSPPPRAAKVPVSSTASKSSKSKKKEKKAVEDPLQEDVRDVVERGSPRQSRITQVRNEGLPVPEYVTTVMKAEDGSLPKLEPQALRAFLEGDRAFELDQYYDSIAPHTFPANFVRFTPEDGEVLSLWFRGAPLSGPQQERFDALRLKLDEAIQGMVVDGKAFVRFSTRSPKDAVDKQANTADLVREELLARAEELNVEVEDLSAQEQLQAAKRAFFNVMAVSSADEALALMATSARAISDLKVARDHQDILDWNLHFVVRPFIEMPLQGELRGFVKDGKLCALSQYYTECFFPDMGDNAEEMITAVTTLFDTLKGHLPMQDCIIDFVVTPDGARVVELNPYSTRTGSCFFDWEADREQLEGGDLEFRYRSEAPPEAMSRALLRPWKHLLPAPPAGKSREKNEGCTFM